MKGANTPMSALKIKENSTKLLSKRYLVRLTQGLFETGWYIYLHHISDIASLSIFWLSALMHSRW